MKTLNVEYVTNDTFELDFDLEECFSWYVKWGVLFVTHKEGDEEEQYQPDICNSDEPSFKWPSRLFLDDNEISVR